MVEIVRLSPAALAALAAGDQVAAEAASPVPLGDRLTGPHHRPLWQRRDRQVTADPGAADWVTGVVWDPERAVAVGRAGFHGPPDEAGMVEVGYEIDPPYRRQGYARAALRLLLARAAGEPAVRVVRASVRPDNTPSLALVTAHGFAPVGEQWDDEDGLETVLEVAPERTRVRTVVLHPSEPLVLRAEPEIVLPGRVWHAETPRLVAGFREQHGLDLTVLAAAETGLLTVLRAPAPDGLDWVEPAGATADLVRRATAPGEEELRQPWLHRDWLPAAEAWLGGPVRQHKVWDLSCVLQAGDRWFKATVDAPLFAPEAAVTAALARVLPGRAPAPLAVDPDRGWLVLPDVGPPIGWDAPVEVRAEVLRRWARTQQASVPHLAELRAAGCLDRGLDWLAGAVRAEFTVDRLRPFTGAGTAERLAAAVPRLRALCAELAAYGLPDTLQHGDLHPANMTRDHVVFDWTDAAVGPPFVDPIMVVLEDDPAVRATLRDAYLGEWPAAAAAAWPVAEVLAAANQAVSYLSLAMFLGADGEPSPIFRSYTAEWLDRVLATGARMGAWSP